MKRWLWYILVVAVAAAAGGQRSSGSDIGDLQPVQVVYLSCANGQVVIETDTGASGAGDNLKTALEGMKATTAAEIFLDTADYLLLSENCKELLPALMTYLRPSCSVCLAVGTPELEQAGAFLGIHAPEVTLMRYRAGERDLQKLVTHEGRMELVS